MERDASATLLQVPTTDWAVQTGILQCLCALPECEVALFKDQSIDTSTRSGTSACTTATLCVADPPRSVACFTCRAVSTPSPDLCKDPPKRADYNSHMHMMAYK